MSVGTLFFVKCSCKSGKYTYVSTSSWKQRTRKVPSDKKLNTWRNWCSQSNDIKNQNVFSSCYCKCTRAVPAMKFIPCV